MNQMPAKPQHYLEAELVELLNGQETFDLLDETVLDGMWLWDVEKPEHEYMSPTFWKTLGFDPSEKEHLASEWFDLIFPDDGKLAQATAEQHFKNPQYPYDQVVRYNTKSGDPVTIRCRGQAIVKDGKPYRLFGAHTVVSDMKRTAVEQRVDQMMMLSNDAVVSWTEETGVQTWNKGAEQTYGVLAEDALGNNPFEMSRAQLPMPWSDIKSYLETKGDWLGEIGHVTDNAGGELITATRISSVKLDDGRRLYLKISRDETERISAQTQNTLLLQEMKHRVRNLFAVIQSITRLSARAAKDTDSFAQALQGRIAALSAAHTAGLSDNALGPAPLKTILMQVLEPYLSGSVLLDAPKEEIILREASLTPFSLMLNELATNAAKYGGWSSVDGNVRIKWRSIVKDDDPFVKLEWTETVPDKPVPPVPDNSSIPHGFGTLLIENSAKQLRGEFERIRTGNKLCITFTFQP
jgi:PAS domain S-box-containing protein